MFTLRTKTFIITNLCFDALICMHLHSCAVCGNFERRLLLILFIIYSPCICIDDDDDLCTEQLLHDLEKEVERTAHRKHMVLSTCAEGRKPHLCDFCFLHFEMSLYFPLNALQTIRRLQRFWCCFLGCFFV